MGIPKSFGISKISMLRGEEDNRYGGQREASSSSSRQRRDSQLEQLSFELDSTRDAIALVQPPSFNVLYVSTPRIGILQTAQFRAVAELWQETVELVKPLLRFGFPETSLKTKCPYYDDKLYATSSGILLANDRTRTVMDGFHKGYLGPTHSTAAAALTGAPYHEQHQPGNISSSTQQQQQQQREPGQSVGMFGISTLAFLASQIMPGRKQQQQQQQQQQVLLPPQQQQQQQLVLAGSELQAATAPSQHRGHHGHVHGAIPRGHFLVPDIPSGTLVLGLNLMAYWAITNQSRRSSMGGTMT